MLNTEGSRIDRMEKEIESLRRTQTSILKLIGGMAKSPAVNTNGLAETLQRLKNESEQDPVFQPLPDIQAKLGERKDMLRECHAILVAIADHFGLNYEKPGSDS